MASRYIDGCSTYSEDIRWLSAKSLFNRLMGGKKIDYLISVMLWKDSRICAPLELLFEASHVPTGDVALPASIHIFGRRQNAGKGGKSVPSGLTYHPFAFFLCHFILHKHYAHSQFRIKEALRACDMGLIMGGDIDGRSLSAFANHIHSLCTPPTPLIIKVTRSLFWCFIDYKRTLIFDRFFSFTFYKFISCE